MKHTLSIRGWTLPFFFWSVYFLIQPGFIFKSNLQALDIYVRNSYLIRKIPSLSETHKSLGSSKGSPTTSSSHLATFFCHSGSSFPFNCHIENKNNKEYLNKDLCVKAIQCPTIVRHNPSCAIDNVPFLRGFGSGHCLPWLARKNLPLVLMYKQSLH